MITNENDRKRVRLQPVESSSHCRLYKTNSSMKQEWSQGPHEKTRRDRHCESPAQSHNSMDLHSQAEASDYRPSPSHSSDSHSDSSNSSSSSSSDSGSSSSI